MSTKIEWTDETWNPIAGCSDKSSGCANCYARTMAGRLEAMGVAKYAGLTVLQGSHRVWTGKISFDEAALLAPVRRKKPTRYFVNSMSDLFHHSVTDEQIDRVFAVMALCPHHTFQVLTKRPERMLAYLSAPDRQKLVARACIDPENDYPIHDGYFSCDEPGNLNLYEVFWKNCRLYFKDEEDVIREAHDEARWMQFVAADFHWPLPNVWLGVSVEDQKTADARIPLLLQTPAAVRFISAEPLLGSINLIRLEQNYGEADEDGNVDGFCINSLCGEAFDDMVGDLTEEEVPGSGVKLDWVIVGGESDSNGERKARPMHPDWARGLRDQCEAAGVPFFFKQWGEWAPYATRFAGDNDERGKWDDAVNLDGSTGHVAMTSDGSFTNYSMNLTDGFYVVSRVGKKAAGHLLDGKEWHQFPKERGER